MSAASCKTCAHCAPASHPKAARSYVQCTAPIETPALPVNGGQGTLVRAAIEAAQREPRNWTTIKHVEGELEGRPAAGVGCPLWKERAA